MPRVAKPECPTPPEVARLVQVLYQETLPHCHHPLGVEGVGRMMKKLLAVASEHPGVIPTIRASLDQQYPNSVVA